MYRVISYFSMIHPDRFVFRMKSSFSVSIDPLIDNYGRRHTYLRMSLTEKCNLRCQYCMPEDGVSLTPRAQLLSTQERKRLINIFAELGVNKLRFTGGEPTLSKDLVELVRFSKASGILSIGITTNGIQVGSKLLNELVEAGLTSINISMDSLNEDKFASITRRDRRGLLKVLSTVYAAVVHPQLHVKVNCVLMKGFNDGELLEFLDLSRENKIDCRFIELMPFDGNGWTTEKMLTYFEAVDILKTQGVHLMADKQITKDPHDTTKWYRAEGHIGRVGFITSMSKNFCGGCNRLRITADGKLKVCLFGSDEMNLRDLLRAKEFEDGEADGNYSDRILVSKIGSAVRGKHAALGGHASPEDIAKVGNRPMILIGG